MSIKYRWWAPKFFGGRFKRGKKLNICGPHGRQDPRILVKRAVLRTLSQPHYVTYLKSNWNLLIQPAFVKLYLFKLWFSGIVFVYNFFLRKLNMHFSFHYFFYFLSNLKIQADKKKCMRSFNIFITIDVYNCFFFISLFLLYIKVFHSLSLKDSCDSLVNGYNDVSKQKWWKLIFC